MGREPIDAKDLQHECEHLDNIDGVFNDEHDVKINIRAIFLNFKILPMQVIDDPQ